MWCFFANSNIIKTTMFSMLFRRRKRYFLEYIATVVIFDVTFVRGKMFLRLLERVYKIYWLPVNSCVGTNSKLMCTLVNTANGLSPKEQMIKWAATWQNQQNECAPSEVSDQLGHLPSLIRSSLCAHWIAKDPRFLQVDFEDSDQTGQMPRLIWVFAGRRVTLLVLSCHSLNGVVLQRMHTVCFPTTHSLYHNTAKTVLELTEFSRWLPP